MKPSLFLAFALSLSLISACSVQQKQAPPLTAVAKTEILYPQASMDPKAEADLSILMLSDLQGVIKPCGCTLELQLGGMDRLLPLIHHEFLDATTRPFLLHAGPLLSRSESLPGMEQQEAEEEAFFIELLKEMPHLIWGLSEKDRADASPSLEALYQSQNLQVLAPLSLRNKPNHPQKILLGDKALKLALLAISQSSFISSNEDEAYAHIQKRLDELHSKADLVLLLSDLGLRHTKRLLRQTQGIDIALIGQLEEALTAKPQLELYEGTQIVRLGGEGQNLGRLDFFLEADGRVSFQFELIPVDWKRPQDAGILSRMKTFDETLKVLHAQAPPPLPPLKPGQAHHVGVDTCLSCHSEARYFWDHTAHGRAWNTLQVAGKTHDANCVSCHVTAYGDAGGSWIGHVKGKENVQCEACHGPGSEHIENGNPLKIIGKPKEENCISCHNAKHSPRFQFSSYKEKLMVKGHGRPMSD